ncbi:MAG: hypothetical protein K9M49_08145 [Candidatus Marinimicrobia bacterium]|nr:hypothetical protein [Candidatus Neomarinimicrobiota bacterium]
MNKQRHIIFFLFLLVLVQGLFGQPRSKSRNISFDCVVCHVTWHENAQAENSLIPKLDAPIQIEGIPSHIPAKKACASCHDGTVMDSREVFRSNNHALGMDMTKIKIRDLPLDKNKKIYCGTCHTPHSLKPIVPGGLAPFIRKEVKNSDLCISCHADQAEKHFNHPIHIPVNADHKMPAGTFFGANNTIECMTCHPIHGEQSTIGVTGSDRSELCSSCHESYFNIELTDHDLATSFKSTSGALGPSFGEQDACATCHTSHGGNGKFMWAVELTPEDGENSYCLGCHNEEGLAQAKAYPHAGHVVNGKKVPASVPALNITAGEEIRCLSCHDPHQWEFSKRHPVTEANEEGTEYTSFLRLPDDAEGQLCTSCHPAKAQITASDHSVVREGFQQHFRNTDAFRGQCSACHETHGDFGYKTNTAEVGEDVTRELCEFCHSEAHYPTTVGGLDHPMGGDLKAASDVLHGFDGTITCITCHDPHLWGSAENTSRVADLDGNDRNSFLRIKNWPEPNLCIECHSEQKDVIGTDHDLGDANHSACSFCHSSHNARAEHGLLRSWEASMGNSYNEHFCFSCHQEGKSAENKLPEAWDHPHDYGTVAKNVRGTGDWIDFPVFSETQPEKVFGFIDCFTCHDPHKWSFEDNLVEESGDNNEGSYLTSFLRNPSHKTLCIDCHGPATLWKFNYYHDPVKRKRY